MSDDAVEYDESSHDRDSSERPENLPDQRRPGFRRGEERRLEYKVYGFNAAQKFFEHRPEQIIRGYFLERMAKQFGPIMKALAAGKKAYHLAGEEELERIAGSSHHEGVCLLVRRLPATPCGEWFKRFPRSDAATLVAFDNVSNPHNIGAVLRSCAHFGVPAVLSAEAGILQSGAAVRTAEGGAEFVDTVQFRNLREMMKLARRYEFGIVSTSSHHGSDLFQVDLPTRAVVLFGDEANGLSKPIIAESDIRIKIPGTGAVESLNVSASAAIILGEFWRRRVAE